MLFGDVECETHWCLSNGRMWTCFNIVSYVCELYLFSLSKNNAAYFISKIFALMFIYRKVM